MKIELIEYPTDKDWMAVKRRALVTIWKKPKTPPDMEWKRKMLEARHSPIRRLWFAFEFTGIKYKTSVHLCRHVFAQPYGSTLRRDRQDMYDDDSAPRSTPVNMILDVNAEELMVIANKRLCNKASKETREVVAMMCAAVIEKCPEFEEFLVPMCVYHGGVCHEMQSCRE